jgi:RimJ/RimL family protein N-acetyltransferase
LTKLLKSYGAFKKSVLRDRLRGGKRTHYVLGLFERKTDRFVGLLDMYLFNHELKWANLGYHIQNQYWGLAYAPEACRSLMKFAFKYLNIHRIEASMLTGNIASLQLVKKLDMVYEGTMNIFFPGEKTGELKVYAMNVFDAEK